MSQSSFVIRGLSESENECVNQVINDLQNQVDGLNNINNYNENYYINNNNLGENPIMDNDSQNKQNCIYTIKEETISHSNADFIKVDENTNINGLNTESTLNNKMQGSDINVNFLRKSEISSNYDTKGKMEIVASEMNFNYSNTEDI